MAKQFHAGKWYSAPGELTPAERAELFGDDDLDAKRVAARAEQEAWLVERLRSGLPMSHDAKRQARRILKGRA